MMSTVVEQSCKKGSPSCWLLSLPDEMVLNCFARVSRVDLTALSMVSKRCRSLVFSPDLYETRLRMGCTEECVYVFFHNPLESTPLWFILRRVRGKSFENRLIPIPSFPTPRFSSIFAFGGGIYVIGGLIESAKTKLVSFLDCRTHTWSYLPSMRIARRRPKVSVLDGKIYVIGGIDMKMNDPSNWAEVFDSKMQTWSGVNIQDPEIKHGLWQLNGLHSKIYNFRAEEGMWNELKKKGDCDVKRLLYCCDLEGRIMWCEPWSEVRSGRMIWRKVYGLEESFRLSPESFLSGGEIADVWHCYMFKHGHINGLSIPGYKLSNSNGNIIIVWNKFIEEDPKRNEIWCAEISMEKREGGEVWGTIQWSEHVYTVDHLPCGPMVLHSVSLNVRNNLLYLLQISLNI